MTVCELREKPRKEGLNFFLGHTQNYIHARTMQHCDVLKVKNALVKFTHCVTKCNICCLLVSNPGIVHKRTHKTVSLFHRAFFNLIMYKTPTHAIFHSTLYYFSVLISLKYTKVFNSTPTCFDLKRSSSGSMTVPC